MDLNPILTAGNAFLTVTSFTANNSATGVQQLYGLPIGTSDGSATGEMGLKVILVGSTGGGATSMGALAAPTASTNGTELSGRPASFSGIRFYIPEGETVTYFFAATGSSPGAPPTNTITQTGQTDGSMVDEPLFGTDAIFITATGAGVLYRWVKTS